MGEAAKKIDNIDYPEKKPKKQRGGARPGSGRPRKTKKLSNYELTLQNLNEVLPKSVEVVQNCLNCNDKTIALRAAKMIWDKTLPDQIDMDSKAFKEVSKELMKDLDDGQLISLIEKNTKK